MNRFIAMVIDNNLNTQYTVHAHLSTLFDYNKFEHSENFIKNTQNQHYDLIILNTNLFKEPWIQLIKEIRDYEAKKNQEKSYIILLLSNSDPILDVDNRVLILREEQSYSHLDSLIIKVYLTKYNDIKKQKEYIKEIIDQESIKQFTGDVSKENLHSFIGLCENRLYKNIRNLSRQAKNKEIMLIYKMLHNLKNNLFYLGNMQLGSICEYLESLAINNHSLDALQLEHFIETLLTYHSLLHIWCVEHEII